MQNKLAAKASYFDEMEVREYFNDVIISNKLQWGRDIVQRRDKDIALAKRNEENKVLT